MHRSWRAPSAILGEHFFFQFSILFLEKNNPCIKKKYSSHENASGKYGYGDESQHGKNFHQKAEHSGHEAKEKGYSQDGKAADHDALHKDAAEHKQNKEAHQSGSGNKYVDDASNYNKDVKTKTFGFFDYRYVQPQYHMEQYHTDEKHANKYAGDEHNAGQQHKDNGGYHADGHQGYGKTISFTNT